MIAAVRKEYKETLDYLIHYCEVKSRYDSTVQEGYSSVLDFLDHFTKPVKTPETYEEYKNFTQEQKAQVKDVGGFIGAISENHGRKKEDIVYRTMVTLDADNLTPESAKKLENLFVYENKSFYCFIYSTRSHTPEKPRLRVVIPLIEPIEITEHEALARAICRTAGMEYFDSTTIDCNRIMYYPSESSDCNNYFCIDNRETKAPLMDGKAYLGEYYGDNWAHRDLWPRFEKEGDYIRSSCNKQEDPRTKDNIIGDFCRCYSISEAIDEFLSDAYDRVDNSRYTYKGGTTYGGAVVYDDVFLHSFHDSDPAGGRLCNAFDLVRLHLYGDTPESQQKMEDFANKDAKVREYINDQAKRDFQELSSENEQTYKPMSYFDDLEKTAKGTIKKTIDNVKIIISNDPKLKPIYLDIFRDELKVNGPLIWDLKEDETEEEIVYEVDIDDTEDTEDTEGKPINVEKHDRQFTDRDHSNLRWYLEKYYGITGMRIISDGLEIAAGERGYHPVKKYFNQLKWDRVERVDTLLTDYFGADDNVFTREAIHKILTAAVARVYEPGYKFDEMVILVGPQGIGKSTFLYNLGKGEWYSNSLSDFKSKEARQQLRGNLIIEVAELNALNKSEMSDQKDFLSTNFDEYRPPYGRTTKRYYRECVFFGTTNDSEFLRDSTGNRRFWIIDCPGEAPEGKELKSVWEDLPNEMDQIWAEVVYNYKIEMQLYGKPNLRLSREAEEIADEQRSMKFENDIYEDDVIQFLLKPVSEDWFEMDYEERKDFLETHKGEPIGDDLIRRDRTNINELVHMVGTIDQDKKELKHRRRFTGIMKHLKGVVFKNSIRFGRDRRTSGYLITDKFYETYGGEEESNEGKIQEN